MHAMESTTTSSDLAVGRPPTKAPGQLLLPGLFTLTAFVGASLLFVVQPMVARLLLPSYGGSATVWSTSSLFFQILLLLGYLYTHWSTNRFGRAWQPRLHVLVLLLPLVVLPVALPADAAPGDSSPALWLLRTLALMIGLPFLVVSTTGPLLQKWYSWTGGYRAEDPYFLFAASNLGSFGGLLAYPFLIEPHLTLAQQRITWSVGFAVFALLTATCGLVAMRSPGPAVPEHDDITVQGLGRARVGRWLALAFLPSALMLAVTAHVSTDIAAIPLLWVVPLAIYLATFVAAFARKSRQAPRRATHLAVGVAFAAAIAGVLPGGNVVVQVVLQMAMLALVGYAAHARLAADRPGPERLTTYFIVVASGGACGGLLNGLVAPVVFDRVLEYPLVMAVVPLLMLRLVRPSEAARAAWQRVAVVGVVVLVVSGAVVGCAATFVGGRDLWFLAFPCLLLVALFLGVRLAYEPRLLMVALVLVLGGQLAVDQVDSLDQRRTFFGSYRVSESDGQHRLIHGTTVHGTQYLDERSTDPTAYYARSGPLGDLFGDASFSNVGVIGLGAGTIAAYGQPGMKLTYFEIDQEIVDLAENPRYFTYLQDSTATIRTVVGDGRLKLAEEPAGEFDLLVLDAFSSDAIPMHLLTLEAMRTYAEHMTEDGVLMVHISNRVFDLEPVLLGAAKRMGWHGAVGQGRSSDGAVASRWAVLTPSATTVERLVDEPGWRAMSGPEITWTDDYSSILSVLE